MADVDWEQFFGFGNLVAPKAYVQAITSLQTLVPRGQITKIQPSTSSGLIVGIITPPWAGFQGVIQMMSNSSAIINMSSSVASGNIARGMNLQVGVPFNFMCDGTNWYVIGTTSS